MKPWKGSASGQRYKQTHNARELAKIAKFDGEPVGDLVDTTAAIPLHSRRTERLQKKSQKKIKRPIPSDAKSLLGLPLDILIEILGFLRPSDIFILLRVNRSMRNFVRQNEKQISKATIHFRYSILTKCFPLPVPFNAIDKDLQSVLLSPRHQQRLLIHKRPYLHIKSANPRSTCSCMSCVMAWNNLNLVIDFAHWQNHLNRREPITMIPRGGQPRWNQDLVASNASIVDKAISYPLWYARLLEKHLDTTLKTIVRHATIRRKQGPPVTVPISGRLYHLSAQDILAETDGFLGRSGPPSYEFPYHRDKYYTLGAYLPNRRWEDDTWLYYGDLHNTDIAWTKRNAEREAALAEEMAQLSLGSDLTR